MINNMNNGTPNGIIKLDGVVFKNFINIIGELSKSAIINMNGEGGLTSQVVDPTNVIYCKVDINPLCIIKNNRYDGFGVDTRSLISHLNMIKDNYLILGFHQEKSLSSDLPVEKLSIQYYNIINDNKIVYNGNIILEDPNGIRVPKIDLKNYDLNCTACLDSKILSKILYNMYVKEDIKDVSIETNGNGWIKLSDVDSNRNIKIKGYNTGKGKTTIQPKNLYNILKRSKNNVLLKWANDYPLYVEYNINDRLYLKYLIAPRITGY